MLTGGIETETERGRLTGETETGKGAEMGTGTGTTSGLGPLPGGTGMWTSVKGVFCSQCH